MTPFKRIHEGISNSIRKYEIIFRRLVQGIVMLLCLIAVTNAFPYSAGLDQPWIMVLLSIVGAFVPLSAGALVVIAVLLLNIFAMSPQLAGLVLLMFVLSYMFCGVYHAKKTYCISGFAVARLWSVAPVIPMHTALTGTGSEVVTVICGATVSFFVQEIRRNAGSLMDTASPLPPLDFIKDRLISNQMFYTYLLAMTVLFLVTYVLRTRNIRYAWIVAICSGLAAEFLIMLTGYLMLSTGNAIPALVYGNVFALITGIISNYLYRDLDYSRIEKVQFEDDEYYYYVTAVPKIRVAGEKKEIKMINRLSRETKKGRNK